MKTPTIHKLKVWMTFYPELENRTKTFELRKNDRDYKVNDFLNLVPFDNIKNKEVECGRHIAKITYVLTDCPEFGLEAGYVILGMKPWEDFTFEEKLIFRLIERGAITSDLTY